MIRRRLGITFGALLAMTVAWRFAPPTTPTLYDGICLSDPYRYVAGNPANVLRSQGASQTYPIQNGQVPTIQFIADNENSPQAQIIILAGSVNIPAGTTSVTLSITPSAPPHVKPPNGWFVDGNVYTFSITTNTGATVSTSESPTVVMRAATTRGSGVIAEFNGNTWTKLKSTAVGCADTLEAAIPALGQYAVIAPPASTHGNQSNNPPPSGFPIITVVVLVVLVALVVAWRYVARDTTRRSPRR